MNQLPSLSKLRGGDAIQLRQALLALAEQVDTGLADSLLALVDRVEVLEAANGEANWA